MWLRHKTLYWSSQAHPCMIYITDTKLPIFNLNSGLTRTRYLSSSAYARYCHVPHMPYSRSFVYRPCPIFGAHSFEASLLQRQQIVLAIDGVVDINMFLLRASLLHAASAAAATMPMLYVNCASGNDASGSGSVADPFLTIMKARDTIRGMQPLTTDVTVLIQESDCFPRDPITGALNFSFPVLELDPDADSGTPAGRITYAAAPGARVRLLGGPEIPSSLWKPYTGAIVQADLGPAGLDVARYGFGSLAAGGLGTCQDTGVELFWGGEPQTLARWPNISPNGTWQWANIQTVTSPLAFTTNATRALSWNGVPNAWLHGYWSEDWADSYVEIANVSASPDGAAIAVDGATPPLYGFEDRARFMAVNILAELDAPGEYYTDTATATLYFWPPGGDVSAGEAFLSVADYVVASGVTTRVGRDGRPHPFVPYTTASERFLAGREAIAAGKPEQLGTGTSDSGVLSYVTLEGLNSYYARQRGIALDSANGVIVRDLEASNHGHNGVTITGTNNTLLRVNSTGTGCEALGMIGGDLTHLVPGGNVVSGCVAARYARTIRTYNPGVGWYGVGNIFDGNTVSDAPHNGMLGSGALNTFTNNNFSHLCFEATDSGAWYSGRSWTNRGNVLANNTFSYIANTEHMTLGAPSVQAIYLDDQLSGTIIDGNACYHSQLCYFVGGGRDTVVSRNYCEDVGTCVHVDNRGMDWQSSACSYNATYTGALVAGLFAVNYTLPPYATAFPSIVDTLAYHPCVPVNITVADNTFCDVHSAFIDASANQTAEWLDAVAGNVNVTNGGACPGPQ